MTRLPRRERSRSPLSNDVARVMQAVHTPHGYTLAVWVAGAACISAHGQPGFGALLSFAIAGTCVLGLITWWVRDHTSSAAPVSTWACVHLVAIVAATVAAWFAALPAAPWCWPACPAASTGVFLLLRSAQDSALRHRQSHTR